MVARVLARVVVPLIETAGILLRRPIRWALLGSLDGAEAVAKRFR